MRARHVSANVEQCTYYFKAIRFSLSLSSSPGANNYAAAGIASCGHYEIVSMEVTHDGAGSHNGNGRTPDSDCAVNMDTEGHYLGGP